MYIEVEAIFDAAMKASNVIHLIDAIQKKKAQIKSVASEICGNCNHWMRSTCKSEKVYKRYRTGNDIACTDFSLSHGSHQLIDIFQKELSELKDKLKIEQCTTSSSTPPDPPL